MTVELGFLVIGIVGLAIVVASLLLGDLLEGVFGAVDLDVGGGVISTPVLGSFLAAFGFGAALVTYTTGLGAAGGAVAGLISGVAVGGLALAMMRSLINMPTDRTPSASDLVGLHGTVVTDVPDGGYGEVSVRSHGHVTKYNARGTEVLRAGQPVKVVEVLSASSVLVRPADAERSSPEQDLGDGHTEP